MNTQPTLLNINGYRVLYINTIKSLTRINGYIRVGHAHGKIGISHLLEHILVDSWVKCNKSCIAYWSKKGIILNAYTSTFHTSFHITGLNDEKDDMYDYISSITTSPNITEEILVNAKHSVKNELLDILNDPQSKLSDHFYKSIDFSNFNLENSSNMPLKLKDLDKITLSDVKKHFDEWYRPDNMFFLIITQNSEKEVKQHMSKFLKIKHPKSKLVRQLLNIKCKNNCKHLIKRHGAEKTTFKIGFLSNKPKKENYIYYDLISDILVGSYTSLLFRVLRDKFKLIYDLKMSFDACEFYVITMITVSCLFENSEKLYKILMKEIRDFVSGKFDKTLIKSSKERLIISEKDSCKNSLDYLSKHYSEQVLFTGEFSNSPEKYYNMILNLKNDKIIRISKKLFNFKNVVVVQES